MTSSDCQLNRAYIQIACAMGEPFNIYRPNFLNVDQTPAFVNTIMLSVKPGGHRQAIPYIPGINYFTVTGDRSKFQPGDILIPVDPTSSIPPLTLLNYSTSQPAIGFITSRLCNIDLNLGNHIYTNVRFDFIAFTTNNQGAINFSPQDRVMTKQIAMWSRTKYRPQSQIDVDGMPYSTAGLKIVEADGSVPVRYTIKGITQIVNMTIFDVVED